MIDNRSLDEAAQILKNGGVVAFPTDTFYALGGNALNTDVIKNIFSIKKRSQSEPLPIFIKSTAELRSVAININPTTIKLANSFWPGQLTLIMDKSPHIPAMLTAGRPDVAVRIPQHILALMLAQRVNFPIVATSANISGEKPCKIYQEIAPNLGSQVGLILEGKCGEHRRPSTIVDARKLPVRIVRVGSVPVESIKSALYDGHTQTN